VEELEKWRKGGPLGKLHNVAIRTHASNQLLAKFKVLSKGLRLPLDNATRWLSWFKLIDRAILLEKPIDRFCDSYLDGSEDSLTAEDWDILKKA
jgi:hypothetical protein